jgi:hypothetical protein
VVEEGPKEVEDDDKEGSWKRERAAAAVGGWEGRRGAEVMVEETSGWVEEEAGEILVAGVGSEASE